MTGCLRCWRTKMKIPKFEDVEKPLVEYISFLLNVRDGFVSKNDTPESLDRKRTELHNKVCTAFGLSLDDRKLVKVYLEYTASTDPKKIAQSVWKHVIDEMSKRSYLSDIRMKCTEKCDCTKYYENRLKRMQEYCTPIFEAFKKDRDSYNDRISAEVEDAYNKGLMCFISYEHDYNGAVGCIKRSLRTMSEFYTFPIEAYTEAAVRAYIEEPVKYIEDSLKTMAAQAAWCYMYHQQFINNETKFKFKKD